MTASQRRELCRKNYGDKARFAKQRHSQILRQKRLREVWQAMSLEDKTRTIQAAPRRGGNNIATLSARAEHMDLNALRKKGRILRRPQ